MSVRERIKNLKRNGIIQRDSSITDPLFGVRTTSEVASIYDPKSIGLERKHVLFKGIPTKNHLDELNRFLNIHPYTHYRAFGFGKDPVIYAQFDIPNGTGSLFNELLNEVHLKIGTKNEILLNQQSMSRFTPEFENWSLDNHTWELTVFPNEPESFSHTLDEKRKEDDLIQLSYLQANLLRELTINGRVSNQTLSNIYKKSTSVISRNLKLIRNKIISNYKLLYNTKFFKLNSINLIHGSFKKTEDSYWLRWLLEQSKLPAEISLSISEKNFVIETLSSPLMNSTLYKKLWDNSERITAIHSLQIHQPDTFLYFFYPENLRTKGKWKTSRSYFIEEPLAEFST